MVTFHFTLRSTLLTGANRIIFFSIKPKCFVCFFFFWGGGLSPIVRNMGRGNSPQPPSPPLFRLPWTGRSSHDIDFNSLSSFPWRPYTRAIFFVQKLTWPAFEQGSLSRKNVYNLCRTHEQIILVKGKTWSCVRPAFEHQEIRNSKY